MTFMVIIAITLIVFLFVFIRFIKLLYKERSVPKDVGILISGYITVTLITIVGAITSVLENLS